MLWAFENDELVDPATAVFNRFYAYDVMEFPDFNITIRAAGEEDIFAEFRSFQCSDIR